MSEVIQNTVISNTVRFVMQTRRLPDHPEWVDYGFTAMTAEQANARCASERKYDEDHLTKPFDYRTVKRVTQDHLLE